MKKHIYLTLAISLLAGSLTQEAHAQILKKVTKKTNQQQQKDTSASKATLSSTEMNSGLKQALSNGLTSSINSLSAKDGFLGDAAVKILMPPEAQKIEKTLRSVGMGKLCDQFISSLNGAAETAVKEAAPVFANSLSKMTITDAYNILLSGKQDAATTFFKTTTTPELTSKFSPIVEGALGKNNVSTYWTQLTSAYNSLPLSLSKVNTDLNAYVTQKAIDGLFIKVADQELKIRNNLGGTRTTPLLQKVFGWADDKK
ncbi:DUF4197 domain-containing protein [Sphingobacterium spiritivorum]|uniref:DUF4197 domain-containing protein n=1 Tax=Sphingobacterium spiritivorum TaxID=258 RepID=UPI00191B2E31|nr:DUF4197 domain-containing protein [Sphingobacterium spiritivorum]QQT27288.1 DUF4197 domain-containing protein [Sphingobacterium spiritivorum]